jgi:hypothetical protein
MDMRESDEEVELETYTCSYCRKDVVTRWAFRKSDGACLGLIRDPKYTLVADWIYHSECWDKMFEENPIPDEETTTTKTTTQ